MDLHRSISRNLHGDDHGKDVRAQFIYKISV